MMSRPNFKGTNNPQWKGGRICSTQGYIFLYAPNHPFANGNNYVKEDRLVMENLIGRYLKPTEIIHHINGIVDDNRLENLLLFGSNSEHMKHHATLKKQANIPMVSEEARLKISKTLAGHPVSSATREKISKSRKGRPCPMKGKHHTEETIQKMKIRWSERKKQKGDLQDGYKSIS